MANVSKLKLPDNTEVNIRDSRVPSVSSTDNGKVLAVVSGVWSTTTMSVESLTTAEIDTIWDNAT